MLGALEGDLARHVIRREKSGAQTRELKARDERLAISAQRCASSQRGERAESKNRGGESEAWQLTDHSPNLGMGTPLGYIQPYGRTGLEPPKIDTLGR